MHIVEKIVWALLLVGLATGAYMKWDESNNTYQPPKHEVIVL